MAHMTTEGALSDMTRDDERWIASWENHRFWKYEADLYRVLCTFMGNEKEASQEAHEIIDHLIEKDLDQ